MNKPRIKSGMDWNSLSEVINLAIKSAKFSGKNLKVVKVPGKIGYRVMNTRTYKHIKNKEHRIMYETEGQ